MVDRCGDCLMFNTRKCSFLYSYSPMPKKNPKVVSTWKELLEWVYNFERDPLQKFKLVKADIRATDYACGDFIHG